MRLRTAAAAMGSARVGAWRPAAEPDAGFASRGKCDSMAAAAGHERPPSRQHLDSGRGPPPGTPPPPAAGRTRCRRRARRGQSSRGRPAPPAPRARRSCTGPPPPQPLPLSRAPPARPPPGRTRARRPPFRPPSLQCRAAGRRSGPLAPRPLHTCTLRRGRSSCPLEKGRNRRQGLQNMAGRPTFLGLEAAQTGPPRGPWAGRRGQ